MCEHGTTRTVEIDGKPVEVDECIADIVIALNAAGIRTRDSCCGHGRNAGGVSMADGRWLLVTTRAGAIGAHASLPYASSNT